MKKTIGTILLGGIFVYWVFYGIFPLYHFYHKWKIEEAATVCEKHRVMTLENGEWGYRSTDNVFSYHEGFENCPAIMAEEDRLGQEEVDNRMKSDEEEVKGALK